MTMDPNVLVALSTFSLALVTTIMTYFTAKNVALTDILARISTLKLLSEEQKEIMESLKTKYGPFDDASNPSWWEKIESSPKALRDTQYLFLLETAIDSLYGEIIHQIMLYKKLVSRLREKYYEKWKADCERSATRNEKPLMREMLQEIKSKLREMGSKYE